MTVIVTAIFHPLPGRKDDLITAMRAGIEAVHTERGCELYAIHDAEDGTVTMIEKWSTVGDLDAHAEGAAIDVLNAGIQGLLAMPVVVTRMFPLPLGDPGAGAL